MAKLEYPGLVLVPPSDRSLLKRRLGKWAFLIISVIGGLSSLNIWLPSSDQNRNCQPGDEAGTASPLRHDCPNTEPTVAATPSSQSEIIVSRRTTTEVPTRVPASQSRAAMPVVGTPSPKRPIGQPPAQPKAGQITTPLPTDSNSGTTNHIAGSVPEDNPSVSPIDPPPLIGPTPAQANPDILLAEQGDAFAQYRLGRFYAQQSGSHSPESVNWYMKASDGLRRLASAGNGKAMYVLGVMYAFGRGVVQNKEEARSWLTQAVAHQVPAAGPVLASLDKDRPADPNPPMGVPVKRRQT